MRIENKRVVRVNEFEFIEGVLPHSFENELVTDLLTLMSSFSARIYGRRSSENRKRKQK